MFIQRDAERGDYMERRRKKTRAAILAAFQELLACKRYENITVQDIIDAADVGRSTFYTHFETKDMLLRAMCEDMFSHVLEDVSDEGSHDFSHDPDNPAMIISHMLYHMQDQQKNIRSLLTCESRDLFLRHDGRNERDGNENARADVKAV